jgi:hypothetical protein
VIWLKGCPRCHGDLILESDGDGTRAKCLQCAREFATVPARSVMGPRAQPRTAGQYGMLSSMRMRR